MPIHYRFPKKTVVYSKNYYCFHRGAIFSWHLFIYTELLDRILFLVLSPMNKTSPFCLRKIFLKRSPHFRASCDIVCARAVASQGKNLQVFYSLGNSKGRIFESQSFACLSVSIKWTYLIFSRLKWDSLDNIARRPKSSLPLRK